MSFTGYWSYGCWDACFQTFHGWLSFSTLCKGFILLYKAESKVLQYSAFPNAFDKVVKGMNHTDYVMSISPDTLWVLLVRFASVLESTTSSLSNHDWP